MSASVSICSSSEGSINGIEVSVSGTPFLAKVPKTLITRDGLTLSLNTCIGGYNNFRWICKGIAYVNIKSQDCSFRNTKEGCRAFEMFIAGLCATHGLQMSSELVQPY